MRFGKGKLGTILSDDYPDMDLERIFHDKDMPRLLAYAATHTDIEDLLTFTDVGGAPARSKGLSFGTRRAFCEAVGVGESTLAGWIKDGRLPPLARAVVGLLLLHHHNLWVKEEDKDHNKRDAVVVRDGDSFMIVDLARGPGQPGEIIARNIPDEKTAFRLLPNNEFKYAVKLALEELGDAKQAGFPIDEELLEFLGGLVSHAPEFEQEVLNFIHKDGDN
jgi:hypothetical protein